MASCSSRIYASPHGLVRGLAGVKRGCAGALSKRHLSDYGGLFEIRVGSTGSLQKPQLRKENENKGLSCRNVQSNGQELQTEDTGKPKIAILLEVEGVIADVSFSGNRHAFNIAFQKLGLDCANWTRPVYMDLLRKAGGDDEMMLYLFFERVGWPTSLPTDEKESFLKNVLREKVAETRFASHTIVLRRLVRVKEALCQMVISNKWGGWKQVDTEKAKIVKDLIFNDDFWNRVEYALELTEPLMSMLRYADTDEPCLGNIYDAMDSMLERMKSVIQRREQDPDTLYSTVEKIVLHRWNKMTTPLHLLAYALSPRYYSSEILDIPGRVPPYRDPEVAAGYKRALSKLFSDPDVASNVRREFVDFVSGKFAEPDAINDQSRLDAIGWWYLHGERYMYLQPLAIKILSQHHALEDYVKSSSLALRPGIDKFVDDAFEEQIPVIILAAYGRNGEETARYIVEKLGSDRAHKFKVVGQAEVEKSFYGQLVLAKGMSTEADELLKNEVANADAAERQTVAEEVVSMLTLSAEIDTAPDEMSKRIITSLRAGAEYADIPFQNCILLSGSLEGVYAAQCIGMPCIVLRSSSMFRAEFPSARAVVEGFGFGELTVSKICRMAK